VSGDGRGQIAAQLSHAYYNGLDRKGWSQYEEKEAVDAIMRLIDAQFDAALEAAESAISPNIVYQYVQEDDWTVCTHCDSIIGDGTDYAAKCPCYYMNQERDAARQQIRDMRRGKPDA
jgi:hypothetical protein